MTSIRTIRKPIKAPTSVARQFLRRDRDAGAGVAGLLVAPGATERRRGALPRVRRRGKVVASTALTTAREDSPMAMKCQKLPLRLNPA